MNSKPLLCLVHILSCGLFGCSTSSQHSAAAAPPKKTAGETDWRITLRAATTNAAAPWMHPFSEPIGTMNYTVPGDAAKILESRPTAELLPFLAKLRMEPPPWKAGIVYERTLSSAMDFTVGLGLSPALLPPQKGLPQRTKFQFPATRSILCIALEIIRLDCSEQTLRIALPFGNYRNKTFRTSPTQFRNKRFSEWPLLAA